MINININYQSRTPIYEQIVLEIERYVALEIIKPNEQLPSIRELASSLGINPNTVKKSYTELENKGVIVTLSTKGTFITDTVSGVIETRVDDKIAEIQKIIRDLEKMGLTKEEIINKVK